MKEVAGYPGYFVTETGVVYSQRKYKRLHKLSQKRTYSGYLSVALFDNEKHYVFVHRIVAGAYIENKENKKTVNHKNGIKTDNRVENLEWATMSENVSHSYKVLGRKSVNFGKFGDKNHSSKSVFQYNKEGDLIREYGSVKEAERITGIKASGIASVARRQKRYKTAGGFIWRYKGDNYA